MRREKVAVVLFLVVFSATACITAWAAQESRLDEKIKQVAGHYNYDEATVSIAGKLYDGYGDMGFPETVGFVTFDIRGWDRFQCWVGIPDSLGHLYGDSGAQTVTVETDGQQVWQGRVKAGEDAVLLDVPLTGKKSLTLRASLPVFAEPKLIKGQPAATAATRPEEPVTTEPIARAPFVIDPKDLEKLAQELRKRVDANPSAKMMVDKGNVALTTFMLVDIPYPSVAAKVAENLSTSLINNGFPLVERGQLDKVIKELKIQDTAMIDPATAQKIGKMTGCNVILVGSISDEGQFLVINCRLLETATGRALCAERVEMRRNPIERGG